MKMGDWGPAGRVFAVTTSVQVSTFHEALPRRRSVIFKESCAAQTRTGPVQNEKFLNHVLTCIKAAV